MGSGHNAAVNGTTLEFPPEVGKFVAEQLRQRQELRYEIDLAESHRGKNAAPEK